MISNRSLERGFQFFAAVLIAAAAYFYLNGNYENVFVAAILGSLCFFIGIRFQVKERLSARNEDRQLEQLKGDREHIAPARDQFEKNAYEADNHD